MQYTEIYCSCISLDLKHMEEVLMMLKLLLLHYANTWMEK